MSADTHLRFAMSLMTDVLLSACVIGLVACNNGNSGSETPPPPGPTLSINSPSAGAALAPGPVLVSFTIQNSLVAPSATKPQMHFYVDGDPVVYTFYDGPGIGEEGSTSGVRYQGIHTHYVHWKSGTSIQLNALASGSHQVRFVLL